MYTRKDGRVVGEYEVNGKIKYIYGRDEAEVAHRVAKAIQERDAGFDSELAVTTGMRQGELLGLQWGDVDFDQARCRCVGPCSTASSTPLRPIAAGAA